MQESHKIHSAHIDKTRIQLDRVEIYRLLGEQQAMVDNHTRDLVEQYMANCLQRSSPEGAFVLIEANTSPQEGEIRLPQISFDIGKIIQNMLQYSESYAFFMVTAGPEPEQMARTLLSEGNYLEGYIVDLVASTIVDLVADQVQEQIKGLAEQYGLRITNRYSPGYCSWNVEEQQKLFSLFPEGCCGISLSDSSLMNPVKSISGIIGLGAEVKYNEYTCKICPMKNCQFRRPGDQ
jgi:hypothetical protein